MNDKINEIIEKYYDETDDIYKSFRHDNEESEYDMQDEIDEYLKSVNATYKLDYTDGFDSPGYSCDVLSIAYLDNGKLELQAILLELY